MSRWLGLTLLQEKRFFELIAKEFSQNASLLVSTHLVVDVEKYLDSAIFLKEAKVVAFGDVGELKKGYSSLEMAYKERLK